MLKRQSVKQLLIIVAAIVLVAGLVGWQVKRSQQTALSGVTGNSANNGNSGDGSDNSSSDSANAKAVHDSAAPPAPGSSSTGSTGAAPTPPASSNPNTVTINNHQFSPANLNVKKGTAITWTNQDSVAHAIATSDGGAGGGPRSPELQPKATYTYTFTNAGTYHYYCVLHPDMTGTITVTN